MNSNEPMHLNPEQLPSIEVSFVDETDMYDLHIDCSAMGSANRVIDAMNDGTATSEQRELFSKATAVPFIQTELAYAMHPSIALDADRSSEQMHMVNTLIRDWLKKHFKREILKKEQF